MIKITIRLTALMKNTAAVIECPTVVKLQLAAIVVLTIKIRVSTGLIEGIVGICPGFSSEYSGKLGYQS